MSTFKQEGKDLVIFATAEDHKEPSTVVLPQPDPQPGLILPNGEINWNCPCLGGMASGPCGIEFREAFTCFHKSETSPKGSECYEKFKEMHLCMAEYPQLYGTDDDDGDLDLNAPESTVDESKAASDSNKVKIEENQPKEKSTIFSDPPKSSSEKDKLNLNVNT